MLRGPSSTIAVVLAALLNHVSHSHGDTTCLVNSRFTSLGYIAPDSVCNKTDFLSGNIPTGRPINDSSIPSLIPQCNRLFILDLGDEFITEKDYQLVEFFLYYASMACLDERIGRNFVVAPLFKQEYLSVCCAINQCGDVISNLQWANYLTHYGGKQLVWNDNGTLLNYAKNLESVLKNNLNFTCRYNSAILISNRVMDWNGAHLSNIYSYFHEVLSYFCIQLTVIIVGRPELTRAQLQRLYGNLTALVYAVPNYDCLGDLFNCIAPCGLENSTSCLQVEQGSCSVPTAPPTTTTTTPPPTTEEYPNSWHIMYLFAVSRNITERQFEDLKTSIEKPIEDYIKVHTQLTVAIMFPTESSSWLSDPNDISDFLDGRLFKDETFKADHPIDKSYPFTSDLFGSAIVKYKDHPASLSSKKPMIVLITDFIAESFVSSLVRNEANWSTLLETDFMFRLYALNAPTYNFFKANKTVNSTCLYRLNLSDLHAIPLDGSIPMASTAAPAPTMSEGTLLGIIVGSFVGCLVLLVACTLIYRQKVARAKKVEKFKDQHNGRGSIVSDFWELSWDRLLVKSEKLGSGAYGMVYRGKIHGKPPCVEHFYSERPQIAQRFENCDVAIKMLPKYASEASKVEFMNEIALMKSIGYNDNIVNMLGCITVDNTNVCLVLEYCPNRDLLQYVKGIKVDMQFSQSMEAKISHTKEFMLFAWQIADGMRFLASKGIIHRDLAARNILIDTERNAKISDFGLCMNTTMHDSVSRKKGVVICESGRLPIKWLAPESLNRHEFSTRSDVWSFGIVLFEVYSFGQVPFAKIEPRKLYNELEKGARPEKPELCNDEMYSVMKKCWHMDPEERPTFQELLTLLTVLLERSTEGYGYLTLLKGSSEDYSSLSKLALAKSFRRSEQLDASAIDAMNSEPLRRRAGSVSVETEMEKPSEKSYFKRHSLFKAPSDKWKNIRRSSTTKKDRPRLT